MKHRSISLFCFMTITLLISLLGKATATDESADTSGTSVAIIGAIVDNSSRIGKEETVAMKIALEDFYHFSNQSFVLHTRSSQGDPLQAVIAARDLIDKQSVQAIIGAQTWEETSLVAEVCSQKSTPLLSLADTSPEWATKKWPYLVQTSPDQFTQMKAIAAIIQSWKWDQVSIIYEDTDSSSTGVLPHLSTALSEAGVEMINLLAIPPFVSSSLSKKLRKIREGQCRVFVVHLSFPLALHFFETAKKMKMMGRDYVWIITHPFTGIVHSLNASTISSMQGIIGVKSYFLDMGQKYEDFYLKFRQKFSLEHPEEYNHEPGIFAAQAYDAARTLALAMRDTNHKKGQVLLDKILLNNFTGLSGKVQFTDQKLAPAHTFQIINVIGKSYRDLGFWSDGLNFWENIGQYVTNSSSMKELGQVFWPGGASYTPRGWTLPFNAQPLRIGVPANSPLKQHVDIVQDRSQNTTSVKGFSIDVFKAIVELLPYYLPYEFFAFNGTYDNMVEQIYLKKYDAVVGDVTILSKHYKYVDFTQPYTESGFVMVVPLQSKTGRKAWLFTKPFTKTMWILIGAMIIYNGFVLWVIERNHNPEIKGSLLNQTFTMLWSSLSSLISLQGDGLHSNLSRMIMVVWLFVALIITQTYTANLASMLTVEQLEPTVENVDQLTSSNAMVGYSRGPYLGKYLHEVLHFHPENSKHIVPLEDIAKAFKSKEIVASFLELAEAKVFFAKHCKGFAQVGPVYKIGGFGFAFPKGSLLLDSVNEALLEVSENGQLNDLENRMLASQECVEVDSGGDTPSLNPNSFWALIMLTGGTSTIALLVYTFRIIRKQRTIWKLTVAMVDYWVSQKRQFLRRVNNVTESSINFPYSSDAPTQV